MTTEELEKLKEMMGKWNEEHPADPPKPIYIPVPYPVYIPTAHPATYPWRPWNPYQPYGDPIWLVTDDSYTWM